MRLDWASSRIIWPWNQASIGAPLPILATQNLWQICWNVQRILCPEKNSVLNLSAWPTKKIIPRYWDVSGWRLDREIKTETTDYVFPATVYENRVKNIPNRMWESDHEESLTNTPLLSCCWFSTNSIDCTVPYSQIDPDLPPTFNNPFLLFHSSHLP